LARRFGEDADPPGRALSSCEARVTTRRSDRGRADTERGAVANPACIARTCIAAPLGVPADAPRLLEKAQQKSLVDISFVTPKGHRSSCITGTNILSMGKQSDSDFSRHRVATLEAPIFRKQKKLGCQERCYFPRASLS
jgi:hypothetical protein